MKVICVRRAEDLIRDLLNTICKNNALLFYASPTGRGTSAAKGEGLPDLSRQMNQRHAGI